MITIIAEVFLGAAGSDGGMDIQEAQKADTDLGLIAEQGDPGCAWPRSQPTACCVGALPTKATQKLDPGAFAPCEVFRTENDTKPDRRWSSAGQRRTRL